MCSFDFDYNVLLLAGLILQSFATLMWCVVAEVALWAASLNHAEECCRTLPVTVPLSVHSGGHDPASVLHKVCLSAVVLMLK